jgi:hypothetical protein
MTYCRDYEFQDFVPNLVIKNFGELEIIHRKY